MPKKHIEKHLHGIEKAKYLKEESDKCALVTAIIIFAIVQEQISTLNITGIYKEEKIKKHKDNHKTDIESVTSQTISHKENIPDKVGTNKDDKDIYKTDIYKTDIDSVTSEAIFSKEKILDKVDTKKKHKDNQKADIHKTDIKNVISETISLKESIPDKVSTNKEHKGTCKSDIVSTISLKENIVKDLDNLGTNNHHKDICKDHKVSPPPEMITVKEDIPKKQVTNKYQKEICKTAIASVKSEIVSLSENIAINPIVINKPVILRVPIVLAQLQITIPIQNTFRLEDMTSDIKRIKKNVYLDEYKLFPISKILFVSGFIKKSLEYINTECTDKLGSSGSSKNSTVIIPFKCTTKVDFITKPVSFTNVSEYEAELLNLYADVSDFDEKNIVGNSCCEQSFKFIETFNEEIFCDLMQSEIIETEFIEKVVEEEFEISKSKTCNNLTDNTVLNLTIRISQNQQVTVS